MLGCWPIRQGKNINPGPGEMHLYEYLEKEYNNYLIIDYQRN